MLRPYDFSEVKQIAVPSVTRATVEAVGAMNVAEEKIYRICELNGGLSALSVIVDGLDDLEDSVAELEKREARS